MRYACLSTEPFIKGELLGILDKPVFVRKRFLFRLKVWLLILNAESNNPEIGLLKPLLKRHAVSKEIFSRLSLCKMKFLLLNKSLSRFIPTRRLLLRNTFVSNILFK